MNFYVYDARCTHCGHGERRHIGKSSAGWSFALHVFPDDGLDTWAAWKDYLRGRHIEDEYGTVVSFEVMVQCVENRSHPRGITRSTVDGRHCVGNGEGTWDYYAGMEKDTHW